MTFFIPWMCCGSCHANIWLFIRVLALLVQFCVAAIIPGIRPVLARMPDETRKQNFLLFIVFFSVVLDGGCHHLRWCQTRPHWGKTHWGKIHWSNVWHIVRPVSSARAPKTGARLTEARALALLPHWGKSARAPNQNLLKTTWSLDFNFHSLDGQIDSNPVYGEFDNRHFEFNQYTNCV